MITPDDINELIDEAIRQLASDSMTEGVECLVELAHIFARAGYKIQPFLDIRQFIINEATARTDIVFIQEKLKIAEQINRKLRNGTSIIIH